MIWLREKRIGADLRALQIEGVPYLQLKAGTHWRVDHHRKCPGSQSGFQQGIYHGK